jgi:uncharacterized protein with PhoU and TrkA domain
MATQQALHKSSHISGFEIAGFQRMKENCGYELVEVMVSPVSSLKGKMLSSVSLPNGTRILSLTRGCETHVDCDKIFLRAGDSLYILTDKVEKIRKLFLF